MQRFTGTMAIHTWILCVAATPVMAEPVFFQHRINDPINLLNAIPAMSAPATDGVQIQLSATRANVFSGGSAGRFPDEETLVMDGEITEVDLRAQMPIGGCYTAAIDSHIVNHSGGNFDDKISEWHAIFGLPDANRDESPYDQVNYIFSAVGPVDEFSGDYTPDVTRHTDPGAGLGDLWLSVQRPLQCQGAVTGGHVRFGVKLPLGDTDAWASGGQTAVFLDWHSQPNPVGKKSRITSSVGLSFSDDWDERFDALAPRKSVGYGAVVFDYRWNARWQSVLQFDIRSASFHSELTEIGTWGAQLHVGLRAELLKNQRLEISFSEDVMIDTAPDIYRNRLTHQSSNSTENTSS